MKIFYILLWLVELWYQKRYKRFRPPNSSRSWETLVCHSNDWLSVVFLRTKHRVRTYFEIFPLSWLEMRIHRPSQCLQQNTFPIPGLTFSSSHNVCDATKTVEHSLNIIPPGLIQFLTIVLIRRWILLDNGGNDLLPAHGLVQLLQRKRISSLSTNCWKSKIRLISLSSWWCFP